MINKLAEALSAVAAVCVFIIFVFVFLAMAGCSSPTQQETVDIRKFLTGVKAANNENFGDVRSELKEQTALLREIKAHVETQSVAVEDEAESTLATPSTPAPIVTPIEDAPAPDPSWVINIEPDCDEPQALESEPDEEWTVADYRLTDYSADWCQPCLQWRGLDEDGNKIRQSDADWVNCKVDVWDIEDRPLDWVTSVPTFRLWRWDGDAWTEIKLWVGYTPAGVINDAIANDIAQQNGDSPESPYEATEEAWPVTNSSRLGGQESSASAVGWRAQAKVRHQAAYLREWLATYDPPPDAATVDPLVMVYVHLINDHGYSASQVIDLSLVDALKLHAATHDNLIGPWA